MTSNSHAHFVNPPSSDKKKKCLLGECLICSLLKKKKTNPTDVPPKRHKSSRAVTAHNAAAGDRSRIPTSPFSADSSSSKCFMTCSSAFSLVPACPLDAFSAAKSTASTALTTPSLCCLACFSSAPAQRFGTPRAAARRPLAAPERRARRKSSGSSVRHRPVSEVDDKTEERVDNISS